MNFEIQFDHENGLVIHNYNENNQVVLSLKNYDVKVIRNGVVIERFEDMLLSEYSNLISNISKSLQ